MEVSAPKIWDPQYKEPKIVSPVSRNCKVVGNHLIHATAQVCTETISDVSRTTAARAQGIATEGRWFGGTLAHAAEDRNFSATASRGPYLRHLPENTKGLFRVFKGYTPRLLHTPTKSLNLSPQILLPTPKKPLKAFGALGYSSSASLSILISRSVCVSTSNAVSTSSQGFLYVTPKARPRGISLALLNEPPSPPRWALGQGGDASQAQRCLRGCWLRLLNLNCSKGLFFQHSRK